MDKAWHIRRGEKADIPAVLQLIKTLAKYENAAEEVIIDAQNLENDGFEAPILFELLVAENNQGIVAMALYYPRYSTWKGRTLFLEDLVVNEAYRRQGIGTALFEALIREARSKGAKRLEWQVLDWNASAIRFYKKFGAQLDETWINGRLDEEQLSAFNI